MKYQVLRMDTPGGPKPLKAPAGWKFDRTAKSVWAQMIGLVNQPTPKTLRDRAIKSGQLYILGNVLANALGMAAPYWEDQAREMAPNAWMKE